ncbi:GDSL esterase/lipase At1g28580-like [Solanum tuberosum]|uniref:GDSL esterase/lipase n=1 Tax=Solanum tuberosum TaxID=4113 RepID=M1ANB9_SOLTU|nr:PREDICTED: GDSL esterase/lipase At1g28580-like [Solanum tuberosum]
MTSSSLKLVKWSFLFLVLNHNFQNIEGCFDSIISFGDSLADTGNKLHITLNKIPPSHFSLPPYGETFFHHPTGRFSDGRLVIDFIAESFGLPLVPAYLEGKDERNYIVKFRQGVNFAVGGATALDSAYLLDKGVTSSNNVSLGTQLDWFKDMMSSFCKFPSECKEFLQNSLILMGEIGGNDFNYGFLGNSTKEEVESYVPAVIKTLSSAIQELIELGASTLLVPGDLPIGCSTAYLTKYMHSDKGQYDPKTGCLNWLNNFSQQYNELLQKELHLLRDLYPAATIIYADYYNAAMQFYASPKSHGFRKGALVACCGAGGPYNFMFSTICGDPAARNICSDTSVYASWDGMHFTEAAYKWIATGLLKGTFTFPPLPKICTDRFNPNVNQFYDSELFGVRYKV